MQHKSLAALAWLDYFSYEYGDSMPDTGKQHLPPCMTRTSVYEQMHSDLEDQGETEIISWSHFLYLWRTLRENIVIPKVVTDEGKP
jgi:hypothetical protein